MVTCSGFISPVHQGQQNCDFPTVTVVMAIRNEAEFIERSLFAVLHQDYPVNNLEIIIADGMSDDNTISLVQHMSLSQLHLHILANPQIIQAAGLNRAIEQARGDIIVRVDGHTVIRHDYVRCCVETLQATGALMVGGCLRPIGRSPMGRAIARAGLSPFAIPAAFRIAKQSGYVDTVYMGAWRRVTLQQVGLFDETLVANEDYELCYRLRKQGGKIYLSQSICSKYYGSETLYALARQHFRYGYWKSVTIRRYPASIRLRQIAAPMLCIYLFAAFLFWGHKPIDRLYVLSGIFVYVLLIAFFTIKYGWSNPTLMWRLLLVYPVIHLTWGAGFWWGIVHEYVGKLR